MKNDKDLILIRLREMALELNCYCESDVLTLTGYLPATLDAKRKRRQIEFVWIGNTRLYPRGQFAEAASVNQRRAKREGSKKGGSL